MVVNNYVVGCDCESITKLVTMIIIFKENIIPLGTGIKYSLKEKERIEYSKLVKTVFLKK